MDGVQWRGLFFILILIVSWLVFGQPALAKDEVITLSTRPGVTQSYYHLYRNFKKPARGHVVLFPGGDGRIGLKDGRITELKSNFLVRTRKAWLEARFFVSIVDVPSDTKSMYFPRKGDGEFRTSEEHAQDIEAIVRDLKKRAKLPVFLVGTSRGTMSVGNVTGKLPPGLVDGIVLTSSVFQPLPMNHTDPRRRGIRGLQQAELVAIQVPTLWVHHKADRCSITSASGLPQAMAWMVKAPLVEKMIISGGGKEKSAPCKGDSHHGFIGQEDEVTEKIIGWIKKRL